MRLPISKLMRNAGFTMIELLVVIAVIGVLAVAVLSSINPIEQINKGRDTRSRSDAAQLISAVDRFYSIHEIYPWNDETYARILGADTIPASAFPDEAVCHAVAPYGMCDVRESASGSVTNWLSGLTDTQEIKDSFATRLRGATAGTSLMVSKAAVANATMYVCFHPQSRAFELEAVSGCQTKTDIPTGACPQGTPGSGYNDTYSGELICLP